MERYLWLAAWWIFVGFLIWAIFAFRSLLSNPWFRDTQGGDITTEVGYEVDAQGRPKRIDSDIASENQLSDIHQAPPSI